MLRRLPWMMLLGAAFSGAAHAAEKFENYTEKIEGTLVSFEMIAVPAGGFEFAIGEERPRRVEVKRFWMGRTEMTWDEFDVFRLALDIPRRVRDEAIARGFDAGTRASSPYTDPTWGFGRDGYPALMMTHGHARTYCEWLSHKTGRKYRLPTEVEWEYACRAGAVERAMDRKELDAIAWHRENSASEEFEDGKTHSAATKKANAWGLHDMLGNVWEWCTTADGKPVARGGSFEQRSGRLHPRLRMTNFDRWTISDPEEPKSRWWLSDGRSAGFRVVREE
jgi:formylglycine-generating enzyme required for sulfatase activity